MKNKIFLKVLLITFCFAALYACNSSKNLSDKFKDSEERLLFNTKNLDGWHVFSKPNSKGKWKAVDGMLFFDSSMEGESGDLVTEDDFENFEFSLDWRISECGNSGIFWGVQDHGTLERVWHSAPEMQVLDNACHPDAKIVTHRAGDLYDLVSCSEETVRPAGEWNSIKIIANEGKYQFWQNGVNVVSFEMFTPKWTSMVAESKFKTKPHFGKYSKGKFALQDHGDDVWFKNIKVREI